MEVVECTEAVENMETLESKNRSYRILILDIPLNHDSTCESPVLTSETNSENFPEKKIEGDFSQAQMSDSASDSKFRTKFVRRNLESSGKTPFYQATTKSKFTFYHQKSNVSKRSHISEK